MSKRLIAEKDRMKGEFRALGESMRLNSSQKERMAELAESWMRKAEKRAKREAKAEAAEALEERRKDAATQMILECGGRIAADMGLDKHEVLSLDADALEDASKPADRREVAVWFGGVLAGLSAAKQKIKN